MDKVQSDAILECMKNGILGTLSKSKRKALSLREIGEIFGYSPASIYRICRPLITWDNIGVVAKQGERGAPENCYYLINDFIIHFRNSKIYFQYFTELI